jgi:hypothetical protein
MTDRGIAVPKVVAMIFVPVGAVLLAIAGYTANRQYTILKTWPTVEAEVSRSEVVRGHDDEGNVMYGLDLEFTYTVKEKKYATPSASPYRTSSRKAMEEKAGTYAVGTRHPIRYDPDNPGEMRFDVGYNLGFFFVPVLLGGMGLVFATIGLVLFRSSSVIPALCPSCGQPLYDSHNLCPNCAAPQSGPGTRAA